MPCKARKSGAAAQLALGKKMARYPAETVDTPARRTYFEPGNPRTQEPKNTRTQEHKNARTQELKNARTQEIKN